MLDAREIHPLTDFLRNHKAHVARPKETHAPEVLTVNGKAEVVRIIARTDEWVEYRYLHGPERAMRVGVGRCKAKNFAAAGWEPEAAVTLRWLKRKRA